MTEKFPTLLLLSPLAERHCPELPFEAPEWELGTLEGNEVVRPGIAILTEPELRDTTANSWFEQVHALRPGRPIVLGDGRDRDLVLHAINHWNAFRLVPPGIENAIEDAVLKAQEAMRQEMELEASVVALEHDSEQLNTTLQDLRAAEQQLLHAERLNTLGRITSGLIPALSGHIQRLEELDEVARETAEQLELGELLDCANQGVLSVRCLLEDIRGYANEREGQFEMTSQPIDNVLSRVAAFGKFDELGQTRKLSTSLEAACAVNLDRYRLHQALLNLMRNAFQATKEGQAVTLRSRRDGSDVVVEVEDEGVGMDDKTREKLFQPFFTTKGSQGMGLGLEMTRKVIERHGGSLTCRSELGNGTTFVVTLPVAQGG